MFRLLVFVKRRPGMSPDEFRRYYEERHTALVAELVAPPMVYRRLYIQPSDPSNINAEGLDFDAVIEIGFEDRQEYQRWSDAMSGPVAGPKIDADIAAFIDPTAFRICVVEP